jgi:Gram-negative bacterial TonB protein C-terminal
VGDHRKRRAARVPVGPIVLAFLGLALGSLAGSRMQPLHPWRPRPVPLALLPEPPWLPVHPERIAELAKLPVYAVCFQGTPPRALVSPPLDLPADHPLRRTGGAVVAHCKIDPEGWVVQAQLLKPDGPRLRQALVRTLFHWRFLPARDAQGKPVAVHFAVVLRIPEAP